VLSTDGGIAMRELIALVYLLIALTGLLATRGL
jgi:hypothetical protein